MGRRRRPTGLALGRGRVPAGAGRALTPLTGASGARYRLDAEPVARGGHGLVYRAVALDDDRPVAIKVSLAGGADAERLLRQAERMAALAAVPEVGVAVVPVWDTGTWDDRAFVVLDWAPRTLRDVDGPAERRVALALRLAGGVAALGAAAVVHGDLKPANVLLGEEDAILLTDFADLERPGFTPGYAPVEQQEGGPPSPAWDLHALAVTVWTLLAGEPPTGPLLPSGEGATADDRVRFDRALPGGRAVRAALEAHLVRDPGARPADPTRLRAALAGWPVEEAPPAGRSAARGLAAAAVLAASAVAFASLARTAGPGCPDGFAAHGRTCVDADGLAIVHVAGATFTMGRRPDDPVDVVPDAPPHEVRLTRSFWLAVTEVTQAQWARVSAERPWERDMVADGGVVVPCAEWKGHSLVGPDLPVHCVSWLEAVRWANARSLRDGLEPAYVVDGDEVTWKRDAAGWRLPTEAEWEHAARAGSRLRFGLVGLPDEVCRIANLRDASAPEKWGNEAPCDDGAPVLSPVGRYPPNAWGLHDVYGNLLEWVWDRYGPYPEGLATDPTGAARGLLRVQRGSSWMHVNKGLAARYASDRDGRTWSIGFRLARDAR